MNPGNAGEIKQQIIQKTGKKEEEINEMIEHKKQKFSGLLTDAGAIFMIAKEIGIESKPAQETKINELKEGMKNVDVKAVIKQVFAPKSFERNGKKGKLQSVMMQDDTGEIRLTLWNTDADNFSAMNLPKGTSLRIHNVGVTSYNQKLQLNFTYNSTIEKENSQEFPEIKQEFTSITELEPNQNRIDVKAEIKKIFPPKEFETERGKGKVINFILAEGMEEIRGTAWNEMVDEIESIGENEKAIIEGAYTKEGMNGIELHLGWASRVMKE